MWVDGVFSGGGMKAIAYAGAIKALEEKNLVFKRLAGTSAGSIVAALLAVNYTADEIIDLLTKLNPESFLKERSWCKNLPMIRWMTLYYRMGLYSGDSFEQWIDGLLRKKGVYTFGDLPFQRLRIIVSDISSGTMVVIPDDLPKYGVDPGTFRVSHAIRMSCSLPFFFEPVPLTDSQGKKFLMIDGGVLSNFPLWLFDGGSTLPVRPFIGLQLSSSKATLSPKKIVNVLDFFHRIFFTMKEAHDAAYISKYAATNIVFIPVHKVETADFSISNEQKEALIQLGYKKAVAFLKKWSF